MKILSSKKDEILKRKADYDSSMKSWKSEFDQRTSRRRKDEYKIIKPVKDFIEGQLNSYSALEFDVRVEPDYLRDDGLTVTIYCNEHNQFSEDSALSWSYDVRLGSRGEVIKESSSWSGLKACTEAQMKSLRQTVDALQTLNELDWEAVIDKTMPGYDEYFGDMPNKPLSEDFDRQLLEAEIEELIGSDKIIKVHSWESCPYGGDVWLKILGETPSHYRAVILPDYIVTGGRASEALENSSNIPRRVRKTSVKPVQPLEIMEV